jgi:oxygen-independent coproporphyrinogen-3 oxidase
VQVKGDGIDVTPLGWYVVRAVAMQFDRYLQANLVRDKFSRVI